MELNICFSSKKVLLRSNNIRILHKLRGLSTVCLPNHNGKETRQALQEMKSIA